MTAAPGIDPDILKVCPLWLDGLDDTALGLFAGRMTRLDCPKGHVLFRCQDRDSFLAMVVSGKIKIHLDLEGGGEHVAAMLGPGSLFGEVALLDGQPRSASATVVEDAELLVLHRDDLDRLALTHPAICLRFILNLAGLIGARLRAANSALAEALHLMDSSPEARSALIP